MAESTEAFSSSPRDAGRRPIAGAPTGEQSVIAQVARWYQWARSDALGTEPPDKLRMVHNAMHCLPGVLRQVLDAQNRSEQFESVYALSRACGVSQSAFRRLVPLAYAFVDGCLAGQQVGNGGEARDEKGA